MDAYLLLRVLAVWLLIGLWASVGVQAQSTTELARRLGLSGEQIEQLIQEYGLRPADVARLSAELAQRLERRLHRNDNPRRRAEYWQQGRVGDRGRIAPAALYRAVLSLEQKYQPRCQGDVAGIPVGTTVRPYALGLKRAGVGPGRWEELGPDQVGGRTRALLINPNAPNEMWAASSGGGIWRSSDAGKNWELTSDGLTHLNVSALAMDPTDPSIIYAGTGESFASEERPGAGLFWRRRGGPWQRITNTQPSPPDYHFSFVNRIAVSKDGRVVLVAAKGGLFRNDGRDKDGNADPDRSYWPQVRTGAFSTVVFHPEDAQRAVAGSQRWGDVILTIDGGETWNTARTSAPWDGRVELAYAKKNPDIVYASVDVAQGQVWRSEDGGRSFTPRTTLDARFEWPWPIRYLEGQGYYGNVIWAGDPNDENLVLVGGIDLWRSTDGGHKFEQISDFTRWPPLSAHADHHVIVAHPHYDAKTYNTVFFGTDGGIFLTEDVRRVGSDRNHEYGWEPRNKGFAVTQFYGVAAVPSGRIVAGAQDNGTWLRLKGTEWHWHKILSADGGWSAIDPTDENIVYGEYQFLDISRVRIPIDGPIGKDERESIIGICPRGKGEPPCWKKSHLPDAKSGDVEFIAPFVLDPTEPKRMLAGGRSLWRTNDARATVSDKEGPSWEAIKPPSGSLINSIAVMPSDSNRVWVCYSRDGEVAVSENATAPEPQWTTLRAPGFSGSRRRCNAIAVDPSNANTAYVGLGGYEAYGLWKIEKQGEKWTDAGWVDLSAGLEPAPVWAVTVHPSRSDWIYVGTDVGLWASTDGGKSWCPGSEGPVDTAVTHLTWTKEKDRAPTLIASTYGRGLFSIRIDSQ